ncbi:MAG: hypothetical protein FJ271_08960 [Planctomycetes bacterium]|nr:hypothetical protein [Planctomycetota bacterium]
MRASSLSSAKVISLLNSYFVPMHMNNQQAESEPNEKAARNRIYRDALAAGLKAGSVCAYMVAPDGRPLAVAPLNDSLATDPERLAGLMEQVIRELKVAKGDALVKPSPPSAPPADADALVLHVVARYLERRGKDLVPHDVKEVLGTRKAGNWGNLPSEGWVVLSKPQWTKLLPPGDVAPNITWELDKKVTARVLNHFYPPTENTDLAKNRIDQQTLQARVEAIDKGVARARLEGRLRMKHPFYHKDDNYFVEADLVGYLEFDVGKQAVLSLRLVTDNGRYGVDGKSMQPFGAAVREVRAAK